MQSTFVNKKSLLYKSDEKDTWSEEQTGRKTEEHFSSSHLSQEPFVGRPRIDFANMFMRSFYACRSQKRKITNDLTCHFRTFGIFKWKSFL